ncbi:MAG: hypothetical protein ACT4QC_09905 [Planctomycetaceae bacterium]
MLKKALVFASLGTLTFAAWLPAYAGAPAKISDVAPVADLAIEADAKIKAIEEALASNEKYMETKSSTLPRDAGVLAVLAQAIVETDENSEWKATAAGVRDGAIAIATATSLEDAKKGFAAVTDARAGKPTNAKSDADWAKLCKLRSVMKEVTFRNNKLRSAKRKMPEKPEEVARHASVLAVLALVAHEDTHEVKDPAQVGEWKKFAMEFQKHMTEAATAFKKADKDAAAKAFDSAATNCNDCHAKFKPDVQ